MRRRALSVMATMWEHAAEREEPGPEFLAGKVNEHDKRKGAPRLQEEQDDDGRR